MLVDKIEFGIIDPDLVKRMAVAKITKTELYDQEGYPIEGGLMDPRLGVVDPGVRCRTCGGSVGEDQGHFGYLELTRPVVHVHYAKFLFSLLKIFCKKCSRVLIDPKELEKLKGKRPSSKELIKLAKKKCPYCNSSQGKLKFIKPYSFSEDNQILNPVTMRERFEKVPSEDLEAIGLKKMRPEWLIITILRLLPIINSLPVNMLSAPQIRAVTQLYMINESLLSSNLKGRLLGIINL